MLNIFKDAISTFGVESQIKKSIEEMGELIVELAHHLDSRNNTLEVAEEIADASIMISQLKLIFDAIMIEEFERKKLERLAERIQKEKRKNEN